jgi:hypothetical protein
MLANVQKEQLSEKWTKYQPSYDQLGRNTQQNKKKVI